MTDSIYIANERIGDVFIREVDRAVILHLGGTEIDSAYYVDVQAWRDLLDVRPPPFPEQYRRKELRGTQMPGIPVIFASPDDRIIDYTFPVFVVRRDEIAEADERIFERTLKYRIPADDAQQVTISTWNGRALSTPLVGYDKYEQQASGDPYDVSYTISCLSSGRAASSTAVKMCHHMMRRFPRKGKPLWVEDNLGKEHVFNMMVSGPSSLREVLDILDRQDGYSLTVTVHAYLSIKEAEEHFAAKDVAVTLHNGV